MTGWRLLHDLRRRGVRLRESTTAGSRPPAPSPMTIAMASAEHRDELFRLLDGEEPCADRFVDAIRAGADLPVLATADREDLRRRLAEWESHRDEEGTHA